MQKLSNRFACPLIFLFILLVSTDVRAQVLPDSLLKKNIHPLMQPVHLINQLEPRMYEYNTARYSNLKLPAGTRTGFITDEVASLFPGMVHYKKISWMKGKNLFQTVTIPQLDMEYLVPLLVASVKEQQQSIDKIKSELAGLKQELAELKKSL